MGRGHTKESDEGDGNSWTHSVPPKEPFTGISSLSLILSKIFHTIMEKNDSNSILFSWAEI